jgi:hypothetical protein
MAAGGRDHATRAIAAELQALREPRNRLARAEHAHPAPVAFRRTVKRIDGARR